MRLLFQKSREIAAITGVESLLQRLRFFTSCHRMIFNHIFCDCSPNDSRNMWKITSLFADFKAVPMERLICTWIHNFGKKTFDFCIYKPTFVLTKLVWNFQVLINIFLFPWSKCEEQRILRCTQLGKFKI